MLGLSPQPVSPALRRGLACGLGGLAVVAVIFTPVWSIRLAHSDAAFAAIMTACIVMLVVTATLIALQARVFGSFALGSLAVGFGLTAATLVPFELVYPGLYGSLPSLLGVTQEAPSALFLLWHLTFLGAAGAYQTAVAFPFRAPPSIRLRRLAVMAGVGVWLGALAVALWWHGLPIMLDAGRFTPFSRFVSLPLTGLLAVLGAIGPPTQRRSHVMLDVCLRVACAMMATDLYLTDVGRGLYTVGWYASLLAEVIALSGTLGVLMWQAAGSYAELDRLASRFQGEALHDGLTGIANRRSFDLEFARRWSAASSASETRGLSVAFVDVDQFKSYNDRFGHAAGDRCLREIAKAIDRTIRGRTDFVARYGGEEFVVLLSDTTRAEALAVLERVRVSVARETATFGERVTVSVGLADMRAGERLADFLERADAALYRAKRDGRDRIVWEERTVA